MQKGAPEQKLGIPEMDAQHDYLFLLFDRLIAQPPLTEKEMELLLEEIGGYLDFHITSEEHLIRHYKSPNFAVHQLDHQQAAEMFVGYLNDFEKGGFNPRTLHNALTGWLSEHCATVDREYARHIHALRGDRNFE